ncbi:MAG: DUF2179 domain-containing protein [Acidobacteriota bacterium]|jgi:uncharacterized protein YebE (UPF0316 family)|nr:DUF2179 domain-containing protein [Acidobacteriota bacterium]
MNLMDFMNSDIYSWVILPLLIFAARICDVSLDTLRIIFINRSLRYWAAACGFFGVLIWLLVIRQIFQQINNPACFIAYPAGFAAGNIVGLIIEGRLSLGKVIVRIITHLKSEELVSALRADGYGLTVLDAKGATGPVKVIFTVMERSDIERVVETIKKYNPHTFYSVEDIRFVSEAVTPYRLPGVSRLRNPFASRSSH